MNDDIIRLKVMRRGENGILWGKILGLDDIINSVESMMNAVLNMLNSIKEIQDSLDKKVDRPLEVVATPTSVSGDTVTLVPDTTFEEAWEAAISGRLIIVRSQSILLYLDGLSDYRMSLGSRSLYFKQIGAINKYSSIYTAVWYYLSHYGHITESFTKTVNPS